MPTIHNNILCVTVDELVDDCGVSKRTVIDGLLSQRKGLVYCWAHHKEGRKVYIHYDELKDNYKLLIKTILCGGVEPALWLKNKEAEKLNNELTELCGNLNSMVEVMPSDVKTFADSMLFTPQEVQQLARAAGWLRLWRRMDTKTARSYGFVSVKDIQTEIFKRCLNEQNNGFVKFPRVITTQRILDRKAREFAKEGLNCLINGGFGNANREKIDTSVHAKLMDLAGNPVKFSFEDIGLFYNSDAKNEGLPRMTVSAIKQHLNKPKNQRIWMYARHGKLDVDLLMQPQIERDAVSRADALWSLDGTTMQLYYRDSNGKVKSDLYVYFVVDVYSSAIIGYSVAFSESTGMVAEALKMAIDTYGYKPYQLQYDNGSANVNKVMHSIMSNMSRVHFPCTPYHGNSKYIETYIGHFQQRVLRYNEAFKGGNITTQSLNSKANPELLKALKADDRLKSEQEIIEMFADAVNVWNNRGEKRNSYGEWVGETKAEKYQHEHADRKQLNYFEKISLFMGEMPQPYQYKQQGITITMSGKTRKYIVPDDNGIGDFEFNRLYLREWFHVRINPLNPDFITLYKNGKLVATAHEKEKYAACVADMKNKPNDASKIKQFIAQKEMYGYDYAMREMERQRVVLHSEGLKATGTDGFGWHDMPKSDYNNIQNKIEDMRNGMTDVSDVDSAKNALLNW
ncbi:DDE-type integrase/transposase/recombinase [Dysgonomonas sp. 520]|uniref:DDE-type integrase/transposase/recombinase n=1 Tax=Dysgonomonas sp. 520 TaxID=2302931 RepID=UPI0013D83E4D|nr:DDE-type integrase/transposase/recombinase [Dysgonomonas sp. 520]NDW10927.1 transposase [Dysgonomonas sp. 520]